MGQAFHENRSHGTAAFPLQVYSHHNKDGFFSVSQHWHEEIEIIYVEKGAIVLVIQGKQVPLSSGQFCFINSGVLHEIKSNGDTLHHAIVFHLNFLDFAVYDACQHNFIRPVTSGKLLFPSVCPDIHPKHKKAIVHHIQSIIELYSTLPSCAFLTIKLHLLHILEALFQSDAFRADRSTEREKNSLELLKGIIEYIHKNYAQHISLQCLADMSFMSPNYFCSYFREKTGKTPVSFVNEYRIEQAAALLTNTELSISQIADSVGFDNLSYFVRKFREYKGVTPKKYRSLI